jgi:hypothetical protein
MNKPLIPSIDEVIVDALISNFNSMNDYELAQIYFLLNTKKFNAEATGRLFSAFHTFVNDNGYTHALCEAISTTEKVSA